MRGSNGFDIRRLALLVVHLCTMAAVLLVVCGCNDQLTRMEENQVKLQAMVAANARELATLSSQVHTGQGKLTEGLQNLDAQAQGIAGAAQTIQDDQQKLRETVLAGNQSLDTKATALRAGQQALETRVSDVQDVTGRTASDLTALARQHTALHETVQANQRELNDHLGAVASNQQGIQAGVARLQQADEGLARDIASVAGKQDAQATAMQDNQKQTVELLAGLTAGHEKLSTDLVDVRNLTQTVATDVTGIADEQTRLHAAVQNGTQTISDKLSILEQNQSNHQAGIERVLSAVNQTASVIATMAAEQTAMQESLAGNHESLTAKIAGLSAGQQTLQSGIDALSSKADEAVVKSATAASALQDVILGNREALMKVMAASIESQQTTQASVDALNGKADGLASTLAAVSSEQAADRETSKTNQQAVITAMAGLADEHQALRAGVERIDGKADQISGGIASVAAEQKALHETAQSNHDSVVARLGNLSSSQAELHGRLSTLNDKANATAAELSAAAQRQNVMQQSLAGVNETLASHVTAVAENQQSLKAGIADLDARTQRVSADLVAATAAQNNFHQMQQSHNEAADARTAALADSQQAIRNQLDTLTATTSQTALSVLTMNNGQATFQQAMQTGMNGLHESASQTAADVHGMAERQAAFQESIKAGNDTLTAQTAAVVEGHQTLKADLGRTSKIIDRAYADLAAISLAQDALQTTLANHSEKITSRVAQIEGNQKTLAENLDVLTATTGQTAIDVLALADGQTDLQRGIKTGSDTTLAQTTALAENQKDLGSHLDVLTATTGQTAIDVLALGSDQSKLTQTVDNGLAGLNERTDRLAANQQKTQAGVDVLTATTGQTALDVIAVADRQNALGNAIRDHSDITAGQMAGLAENQQKVQTGVDVLTATAGQTALDVIAVAQRQDALRNAIQSHDDSTAGRLAKLAGNQQTTQNSVDDLTATAGQTALDVIEVGNRQLTVQKAVRSLSDSTADRMTKIAADQRTMQTGIDALAATTGQTALDVIAVAQQQDALRNAVQSHGEAVAGQVAGLADNQQKIQGGVDALTATAGQTALDVIAVANQQQALQNAMQSHSESAAGRTATLADNQQKMQNGLDSVAATAGKTAQDVLALTEAQAKAAQAAQADRTEVAGKLARIAQDQQNWLQRFDTAQAKMQAMAEVIAGLDQQVGDLQGTLQTGLKDTNALLNTDGQQRQQFEAKIAQDVQTMIEAIAYLRQAQAQLQEQMGQVQKSTQSQADTLKATIDQIKQPRAEVKVSDAAKQPEPAVVQTGE